MRARAWRPLAPFLIPVLLMLAAVQLACTADQRQRTIHTSVITVNALRDGFVEWDKQHQLELVDKAESKEKLDAALDDYHTKRKRVEAGFLIAYQALAVAATQADEFSFQSAMNAAKELEATIAALKEGK